MSKPTPVPAVNGVYFWWFKEIPPGVPAEGCITCDGYTLLYVGISPDHRGKPSSLSNMRKRIKMHYSGNAASSTPRRALGVLLSCLSCFPLRRVLRLVYQFRQKRAVFPPCNAAPLRGQQNIPDRLAQVVRIGNGPAVVLAHAGIQRYTGPPDVSPPLITTSLLMRV